MEITRYKGDTDPIVFTIKKNGVPLDITGSSFTLSYGGASGTVTLPGTLLEPTGGKVSFAVGAGDFPTVKIYKYKVVKTDGSIVKTIIKSSVVIIDDSVQ